MKGVKQWISIKASRKNKNGEGLLIADVIIDDNELTMQETEANANLMAAAPELLATLKEIEKVIAMRYQSGKNITGMDAQIYDKVRAVLIAKGLH